MGSGFLPFSRGTLMLDVVAVAMVIVLPVLSLSLFQIRRRRNVAAHRRLQKSTCLVLAVAIVLFEVDIRLHGWRQLAEPSPFYTTWLFPVLWVHLFFAVSTTLLWSYTIITALRHPPVLRSPGAAPSRHARIGFIAALFMYTTGVTGWTFFYMAFVA